MIKQSINLNMIPNSAPVVVHVNQYDVGEGRIEAKLYNGDTAYTPASGATAVIQGTKPDGRGFDYNATLSGNTVTADVTEQMTAVEGNTRCQIVITEGENVTGTFVFNLMVQKSALPADTDMSRSEYSVVMQLLEQAEALNQFTPYIGANGNWWVYSVQEEGYVDTGVDASISVDIADITMLAPDASPYVTNTGTDSDPVFHLFIPRGKGISSIAKTGTQGLVDTYTITYSDNTTTTFTVTNGADGEDGDKGDKGDTGATPNITATATIDNTTGTPAVNVTKTGTTENPVLNFAFSHLKGAKGDKGDTGTTDAGALVKDTVGWLGKNLAKFAYVETFTEQYYRALDIEMDLEPSTSYILSFDTTNSGNKYYANDTLFNGIDPITADGTRKTVTLTTKSTLDNSQRADGKGWYFLKNYTAQSSAPNFTNVMVTHADITDNTYEPYHVSVEQTLRDAEVIEGKNLLTYPYDETSKTDGKATFTDNKDGTITISSQSAETANYDFRFFGVWGSTNAVIPAGRYTFSLGTDDSNLTAYAIYNATVLGSGNDFTFDAPNGITNLFVRINNGGLLTSPVTIKPMLRLATETDSTYEPYYIPLKDSKIDRAEQRMLGAKNLLAFPYEYGTQTLNGVTFTVNDNGSITINGTATARTSFQLLNSSSSSNNVKTLLGKTLIFKGVVNGDSNFYARINEWGGTAMVDKGEGALITIPSNATGVNAYITIENGKTLNNVTVYPMIRLASDPDDTYAPYAMTNKELTDLLAIKPVTLTLDDSTNIALQNNKSVRQGNIVCVRSQINVKAAKASGSIILKATAKHTQYGGAVLIDTNADNKYNLVVVEQTTGIASFICKTSIPAGWYALTYTWVEN